MKRQIDYIELSKLKKYDKNPRKIEKKQLENLSKSIKGNLEYFEARPIICSNRTGELVILAGNQRFEASKLIKLEKVPVFVIEGLTEEKEKEIVIRDNVSNAEWDNELLAEWDNELLAEWGCDFIPAEPIYDAKKDIKNIVIIPFKKTHVLLSFPPEKMILIQDQLQIIKDIEGVEYEQASN